MNKRNIIILALIAIALCVGMYLYTGKKKADNRIGFETVTVGKADITTSVTATGTLEAVTTVTVGTQV